MRNVGYTNACFKADLVALGLRPGRTLYCTRATFFSTAQAGGASRDDVKRITHPSPNEAADFYERLNALWPASAGRSWRSRTRRGMARDLWLTGRVAARSHVPVLKTRTPATSKGCGRRSWRAIQDSNLWPSAPEADALSS